MKFNIALILPLALLMADASAAQDRRDPCALCIQEEGQQSYDPCIKDLEERDLSFLSGHQPPVTVWKADQDVLPKLCKRIRNGDNKAISIGLRLSVLLDEESSEDVIEALSESIVRNPTGFLGQLQDMMNFCKKENEVGPLKECYWDDFIDNDFGYGNQPEEELRAIRRRREAIQKVDNPFLKEAKTYILELFDEKARRLTTGM